MSLKALNLRPTYSSEESNLLEDFYIPALKASISYDRAVGYFSASMLSYAAQGLSPMVHGEGTIRLLIGEPLDEDELEAVRLGLDLKAIYERLNHKLQNILQHATSQLLRYRLELLSWLVAADRLHIRFAFLPSGMYHEKIGIMRDELGEAIVFQGSANETAPALLPDLNYESIAVFRSWEPAVFQAYADPLVQRFERLWTGHARNVTTMDVPSTLYDTLKAYYKKSAPPEVDEARLQLVQMHIARESDWPQIPANLGGRSYALMDHQREALKEWQARAYRGIMALATGAGKTVTALHGAATLSLANLRKGNRFAVLVAVPYQILADQWSDVMSLYGMTPIRCFRSRAYWSQKLQGAIADFNLSRDGAFLSIVVVNATLATEEFQRIIANIDPRQMMVIGDECHHHAADGWRAALPKADLRLGLSATPWNAGDDRRKASLIEYYGGVVASYSLGQALADHVLTPYRYHMHAVRLTEAEQAEYEDFSASIARLSAIRAQGGEINEDELNRLASGRTRLLGSVDAKFDELATTLRGKPAQSHTLFYCGDGSTDSTNSGNDLRDVERAALILNAAHWKTSRFTAEESHAERIRIMENFVYGYIDAIVAIRVLDEGFDMPACREAYLLASSRSERQFIQRRGRILRRAPGKEYAEIHDFIVLPFESASSTYLVRLVEQELVRALEFIRFSHNESDGRDELLALCDRFGLNVDDIEEAVQKLEINPE